MFEIELYEDYEDNYDYRETEWEEKSRRDKAEHERWASASKKTSNKTGRSIHSVSSSKDSKTSGAKFSNRGFDLPMLGTIKNLDSKV